ncbi:MAG: hypothetical protein AMQ74_01695 [Candidatus Methanofastidiosum methylothiophilum]|uniref:Uncharacterized protein n=1 Tax=Candidatus Methanofastidiosum methylothiophilum TaxID=1705564 RepID=A0A150IQJ7_9EURY|nr:MAG: hypothetical protein AMQ74_01695 [Candidatus Methanofastidiosum methylthiophilus]
MNSRENRQVLVQRFEPRKESKEHIRISNHSVRRYIERFNPKDNNIRKTLDSYMAYGEIIDFFDEKNKVILYKETYLIITNGTLRTVYTKKIYENSKSRIYKRWDKVKRKTL